MIFWALQGSANPQTPGSENKRIKSCVQAEERNFFTSFSQNLGFVDLPMPVRFFPTPGSHT